MRIPLTAILLLRLSMSAQDVPACVASLLDVSVLTAKAESGDPKAQLELGKYYDAVNDQAKFPQAAYWFSKSADQGNPDAEWRLAGAYQVGGGVTPDDRTSLYWFKKAAEDGQIDAEFVLAMNYRDGRNVERNPRKAFDWFMRAARQGHVDAQVSVAQMYEEGEVVPRDYANAAMWYKKAAEQVPDRGGASVARNSLGFLYMDGLGVPRDRVTAYMYFALSNSASNMEWAASNMTIPQVAEAQRRAKEWVSKHLDPPQCANLRQVTTVASNPD